MAHPSVPTVRVSLKPSRYLAIFFCVIHFAAGATLVPLDFPSWVKLFVASGIAASLARSLWRHALLKARSALIGVELREDDQASVQTRDGAWHAARILGTTYVTPLLTVLNLRIEARPFARHVLVVPDNADAEDFRQLRVWLRWAYRKSS